MASTAQAHGVNGSGRDFRRLVRALGVRLGQASLAEAAVERGQPTTLWRDAGDGGSEVACSLLVSGAYAGFTHEGVATLAARLARDIVTASAALPCPHRLSLFGHSLGGVVARAALPTICRDVDAHGLPLEPFAFYAMSSPHLGVRRPHRGRTPQGLFRAAVHGIAGSLYGRTGRELLLEDRGKPGGRPLLEELALPDLPYASALHRFPKRTLISILHHDLFVPFASSSGVMARVRAESGADAFVTPAAFRRSWRIARHSGFEPEVLGHVLPFAPLTPGFHPAAAVDASRADAGAAAGGAEGGDREWVCDGRHELETTRALADAFTQVGWRRLDVVVPTLTPAGKATVHTYTMDKLQPFDLGQASFLESIVDLLLADSEGDTGRAAS